MDVDKTKEDTSVDSGVQKEENPSDTPSSNDAISKIVLPLKLSRADTEPIQSSTYSELGSPTRQEYAVVIKTYDESNVVIEAGSVVTILSKNPESYTIHQETDNITCEIPSDYMNIIENYENAKIAKAIRDVNMRDDTYLSYKAGDTLQVLQETPTGAWIGIHNNRVGFFLPDSIQLETGVVTKDGYPRFFELLMHHDMLITSVFCSVIPSTAADYVSQALITIFEEKNKTLELLRVIINYEVKVTTSAGNLFRANSAASKILSSYARLVGAEYLHHTLRPLVTWIGASSSAFEIDPAKLEVGTVEENRINLMSAAEIFFDRIHKTLSACPNSFRAVCSLLRNAVTDKFPELKDAVIGGFFFLRFMCPAIISPEGFGVLTDGSHPLNPGIRRALVLVSKMIQNLANGKSFGTKEAYMIPMQEFLDKHEEDIRHLFNKLAEIDPDQKAGESLIKVTDTEIAEYLRYMHTQFVMYQSKLENELHKIYEAENGKEDAPPTPLEDVPLVKELRNVMSTLGPPPDEKFQRQRLETFKQDKKKVHIHTFALAGHSVSAQNLTGPSGDNTTNNNHASGHTSIAGNEPIRSPNRASINRIVDFIMRK